MTTLTATAGRLEVELGMGQDRIEVRIVHPARDLGDCRSTACRTRASHPAQLAVVHVAGEPDTEPVGDGTACCWAALTGEVASARTLPHLLDLWAELSIVPGRTVRNPAEPAAPGHAR
jgi:hypothetical protein